jgi:hypothetical protein
VHLATGIRLVVDRGELGAIGDHDVLIVACDRQVDHRVQQFCLALPGLVDRLHRDPGLASDVGNRRRGIPLRREETGRRVQYPASGRTPLLLRTLASSPCVVAAPLCRHDT